MKEKYLALYLMTIIMLSSCLTKEDYNRNHGNPKYRVSLIGADGSVLETRLAHERYDSWDWGLHKNYEFRYYYFRCYKNSEKWGDIHSQEWEWQKISTKVEGINY